jgi:hypothetical protein
MATQMKHTSTNPLNLDLTLGEVMPVFPDVCPKDFLSILQKCCTLYQDIDVAVFFLWTSYVSLMMMMMMIV